jgi:hypothetical protein
VLTVATVSFVLVVGLDSTDESTRQAEVERAEQTLTQFDSKSAMVALGRTDRQRVELGQTNSGSYTVREDSGWMRVTLTNRSSNATTTLLNATLGALVYEGADTTVGYQGGGVWKQTGGRTTMVSPPEFHYRNATLTLPVVVVEGSQTISGEAVVSERNTTERVFPNATTNENFTNPLENNQIEVTVHSDYYEGWGTYFKQRTQGSVAYDHDRERTTVTLETPTAARSVQNALAATAAGGEIRISGTGARTDSYSSLEGGTYDSTAGSNGSIVTAGDVYVGGDGRVNGTVVSGKSVQITGNGDVDGDVFYTTSEKIKEKNVKGTVERIDGVESSNAVDSFVTSRVDEVESDNNNTETSVISGEELDFSGTTTLDPGSYYVENLTVDNGDTLVLDTEDENLTIAVENYVRIEDNSTIEAQGDGRVNIFVGGNNSDPVSNDDFTIATSGGEVQVPEQNSTMLWVYGKSDFEASIDGSASSHQRFEGVFYAPGGATGGSSVYIKHGDVFGGVVAATVEVDQGGAVHFDRALTNETVLPEGTKIIRITFLHVTINRVVIEDG